MRVLNLPQYPHYVPYDVIGVRVSSIKDRIHVSLFHSLTNDVGPSSNTSLTTKPSLLLLRSIDSRESPLLVSLFTFTEP